MQDPLNLASEAMLVPLRHAELKHGRLAMLAALGWPVAEWMHPVLVTNLGSRDLLQEGCAPTVLNGGLTTPEATASLLVLLLIGSVFESKDIRMRASQGFKFNEYARDSVAGDVSFDPLNIATELPVTDRFELQEAEMLNGRLAMLTVLAYAAIEAGLHMPIVSFSPSMLTF